MFSYIRRGEKKDYVIILNFSTNSYDHQQFGVPDKGVYKEVMNTQWKKYHGTWNGMKRHKLAIPFVFQGIINHS